MLSNARILNECLPVGSYFIKKNKYGITIAVNVDTYRTKITDIFVPILHGIVVPYVTIYLLHQTYDNRLIS